MPSHSQHSEQAPLSGPRMPADHGLTSLGLLMQIGGAVFAAICAVFALILLLTGAPMDVLFAPVAVSST